MDLTALKTLNDIPGPLSRELVDILSATESPAFTARRKRREEASGAPNDPIVWREAHGAYVTDVDGNTFIDMTAGFGAASIGYGHPKVVAAITEQSERLVHAMGDVYPSDTKIALLKKLAGMAPWPDARVILGLTGNDAVESALKTAVLATGKPGVLAFKGSYHGLGHGPLAACGYQEAFRSPFEGQLNPHVIFAEYPRVKEGESHGEQTQNALNAVERTWDTFGKQVGAVLIEPIIGRGGVWIPPKGFLSRLREMCTQRGAVFIVDEILTGLGRVGGLFRSVAEGAQPDLLCIGKTLGGGMPVSACLGRASLMQAWGNPDREAIHTATHFGQPVGCAAALAALSVLEDEQLIEKSQRLGDLLLKRLKEVCAKYPFVLNVRGSGLLIGVELDRGERTFFLIRKLLLRGFITLSAGKKAEVLSLTPPFVLTEAEIERFVEALDASLGEVA